MLRVVFLDLYLSVLVHRTRTGKNSAFNRNYSRTPLKRQTLVRFKYGFPIHKKSGPPSLARHPIFLGTSLANPPNIVTRYLAEKFNFVRAAA
jgi:hypothetical protein